MRYLPSRVTQIETAQVKPAISDVRHLSAPLKGLSLSSKLSTGDPMAAPILTNWVIGEDRIRVRPGYRLIRKISSTPVETFLSYSGVPSKMLAGSGGVVYEATSGASVKTGFTSNDWHWTMFANLSQVKYLMAVNGANGVHSYDGTTMVKQTITAPAGKPHIIPDNFNIVLTHMNRLWFADKANLSVYYLPVQNIAGEVKEVPVGAIFRRGGTIRALGSWSIDGGTGMDDRLCIFSDQGECAIYSGLDPDSDFSLVGLFSFDAPMSKHCVVNFGGDIYVLISGGLVPMSILIRAETEKLNISDQNVISEFRANSIRYRSTPGWQLILDNESGHMICNMPGGAANRYGQLVRKMHVAYWTQWRDIPSRCWGWLTNQLYVGDDSGNVFEVDEATLNDNGEAIYVDVQLAWSAYGTPAIKHFKQLRPYIFTDGVPRPFMDVRVNYTNKPPKNQPDVTFTAPGAVWNEAIWDVDDWAQPVKAWASWQGCGAIGRVGAPRLTASILNSEFEISGFDVVFETGTIIG